jgi:predicted glutamine amidotransferase
MCELLGIVSPRPVNARFSLPRLASHARLPGEPIDGWGVALFDGPDVRVYREPEPAGKSAFLEFLENHQPPSRLIVSHIRLATAGDVALRNTHPFVRELGGRMHVFAHNGRLDGIAAVARKAECVRPIGDSDSELAFCVLLERLAPLWREGVPPLAERMAAVAAFAEFLRSLGPANFLYADGDALYAHAHRRRQRSGVVAPPGLWHLSCTCADAETAMREAGVAVAPRAVPERVDVFASVPLAEGPWQPLVEGELKVIPLD